MIAFSMHDVQCIFMQTPDIPFLVRELVSADPIGQTGVAAKLGVSASTVGRWLSGTTHPRPSIEGQIRKLAGDMSTSWVCESLPLYDQHEPDRDEYLRSVVATTLREVRETLHRSGCLSSRHEALDEISKLLFAHIISLQNGGPGISTALGKDTKSPAKALKDFTSKIYSRHLPISLAHELKPSDFHLRLKESENLFADEIISCFDGISNSKFSACFSGPDSADILNDVFGQFLSDSFVDEKELGQYLTPTEIVRFMSRLGINSLSLQDFETLCHPENCSDFGIILDPSCGVGSFLTEVLKSLHTEVHKRHGSAGVGDWVNRMVRSVLVGIDKSERMIRLSLTNLALFGSPAANLHFANSLARKGPDAEITTGLEGKVKLILTNPPFGAEFPRASLMEYKVASEWLRRTPKALDSEMIFLERYIDWLTPEGTLIAIVPDSILTNRGIYQDLRAGLSPRVELRSVISLPPVTFGAAGTTTKTSVLHLTKKTKMVRRDKVYFSICHDVGYEITTRASQRKKVSKGRNDLVEILPEASRDREPCIGRLVNISPYVPRWDATYHAGLSNEIADLIENPKETDIFVREVATLSTTRIDPRRFNASSVFLYIEISDVDSGTLGVTAKAIQCEQAPSRARKLVRTGDVLVSTVRPERRTIGVVPRELDKAVCSTGFAVLQCKRIESILLARLLQSDFANEQILRNNIGIAYPAINEERLLDIVLPLSRKDIHSLQEEANKIRDLRSKLVQEEHMFSKSVDQLISIWHTAKSSKQDPIPHQLY
ncbi:MAG: N-6 DNA methylase [Nitrospira sp. SB0677_bin_15]|nr:N-6 DNA methylase [Nitrospira sp. SB0677_bin_15]